MSLNVLIADNAPDWTSTVKKGLESELFKVFIAQTGKQAQVKLYHEKIYATILSWNIEKHSAPEVAAFMRHNHPGVMLIAKLQSLDDLDMPLEEFQKLHGLSAVITEKTDERSIIEILENGSFEVTFQKKKSKNQKVSDEVEVDGSDDQFRGIKVDELYSGRNVLFDIYVKLRPNRYIKILHAGDTFSEERLNKYKYEKKIEYFYFHIKDRKKFIQFNNMLTKKMISANSVDSST